MPATRFKPIVAIAAALATGFACAQHMHENHRHDFAGDIDAFHSVLAPLWHAAESQERSRNVCAQADQLGRLAQNVRSADATALRAATAGLRDKCQSGPAGIDAALTQVHDAFHRLAEPGRR